MNRNTESHFSLAPHVDISRSRFDRSASLKTSFNVGEVIPFFLDEVLPGDTFSVDTSKVVRMQTLLTPMMDNVYLDTYYFFVPNRLVWDHWKQFCGENTESAWIPETEYTMPQITAPADKGWVVGTLADYFGIPMVSLSTVNIKRVNCAECTPNVNGRTVGVPRRLDRGTLLAANAAFKKKYL